MQEFEPSRTAETAAAPRALESQKPIDQRICSDPFAERFLSPTFSLLGETRVPKFLANWIYKRMLPGFFGFTVARTRHIDEILQTCIKNGLEQLVILGAGYDSRAYRFEQLKGQARVFEVDHPATQQVKVTKLKEILGSLPNHVVLVPIDFTQQTLSQRLFERGYEKQRNTLFIWEGVTYYMTPEAVDVTLAFVVNNSGKGSSIVFDYTHPSVVEGTCTRREAKMFLRGADSFDEPLSFGIAEGTVESFLRQRGFGQANNVTNEWLKQRYFTGVNRKRAITPIFEIVHAIIQ
jgi:methyltransferase (TIGR00027 family)